MISNPKITSGTASGAGSRTALSVQLGWFSNVNLARDNNRRGLVSLRHHLPFDNDQALREVRIFFCCFVFRFAPRRNVTCGRWECGALALLGTVFTWANWVAWQGWQPAIWPLQAAQSRLYVTGQNQEFGMFCRGCRTRLSLQRKREPL
jgi:hypothetical protein